MKNPRSWIPKQARGILHPDELIQRDRAKMATLIQDDLKQLGMRVQVVPSSSLTAGPRHADEGIRRLRHGHSQL